MATKNCLKNVSETGAGFSENYTQGFLSEHVREFKIAFSSEEEKSDQASRPISTGRLNGLLHLHVQPINPVVCRGSLGTLRSGKPYLGRSLALRCFQRLSLPHMATQRCP
jgi:hypothetical protein